MRQRYLLGILAAVSVASGCSVADPQIPPPRPIIVYSGERITPDHERMKVVNDWVTREQRNIVEDPSFWVIGQPSTEPVYPWEGLIVSNDTVSIQIDVSAPDSRLVYEIYGHLHLMSAMGRQEEWLPEAPEAVGYELERAILARCADAWLLGRSTFDTAPYEPLDELMYAAEAGFLEAFIFTARPDEFATSRAEWARANRAEADAYREWFLNTFNREPPGLRSE